jgi:Glycosyl hydrolases family 28/Bacterial Ig-like domain (group 3)
MQFRREIKAGAVLLAMALGGACAYAQDTRTVVEPTFPASCTVLQSQIAIVSKEPASETTFDTTRIQTALNACPVGQAVELQASGTNNAFLIQPITIPTGVTLLVDGGVTVFASRNPADYQIAGNETCGTVGTAGNGCNPVININKNAASTGSGIMGYGIIDGRGEDKLLVNGAASTSSWWDVATAADVAGGAQNNPILLSMSKASNFTLYKITFKNSAMFHVKWSGGNGFTAWGVKVATPYTARNSDGIDPSGNNITVTNSSLSDGDDDVAISASSAASNITISNNNTYSGHGISVGSFTQGGLTNMLVTNINQAGTAADGNGIALRIKSALDRGGLVQNVTYSNICMQNHKTLIDIDPFYNANAGTLVPQFSNITFTNVHGLTSGVMTLEGHDVGHPTTITLNNFVFDALTQANISPSFSFDTITLGPGPVSPAFLQTQTGSGVAYNGNVSNPTLAPYPCSAANFTFLVGELYLSNSTVTNAQQLTNVPGPGTVTLNAMLQPTMSQVTYGAYTGMPAPTAAVQFFEGSTMVGTASLGGNGSLASLTLTGVTTGSHTYVAKYPGDSTYAAYTFGNVSVTVIATAAPSTIAVAAAPATLQAGSTTILTATITGTSLAAGPTGTVNFLDGTTVIGSGTVGTNSKASYTALLNGPATHNITAVYLGDPNNAGSTSAAAPVTVTAIPTTTSISLSSSSVAAGTSATITAFLSSSAGVPTGTVTFLNGTTTLGTGTLSNGTATFSATSAAVASESITATYAAQGNYAASTSNALALSFASPVALSVSAFEVNMNPGSSTSVTVTANPALNFAGAVSFTCATPSTYLTCSMTPASQTVAGGASVQSVVGLNLAATVGGVRPAERPFGGGRSGPVYGLLLPVGALVFFGLRRRGSLRLLGVLLVLAAGVTLGITGCSSSSPKTAPIGTQVVTVTATAGSIVQTAQITVNIISQ